MAPRYKISVPTNAALPHSHRLPPNDPDVTKALLKLSRPALLSVVLEWLSDKHIGYCKPYLAEDEETEEEDDEDAPYDAVDTIDELREIYEELKARTGGKREVVDRILEGDWRRGISLFQLAMTEAQHLLDRPASLRWTALKLARSKDEDAEETQHMEAEGKPEPIPRIHAPTFLLNLQREVAPLTKAHYYLTGFPDLPLSLLRIYIHDSPYNTQSSLKTQLQSAPSPKSLFLLFPSSTPFLYVAQAANPTATPGVDVKNLRRVVLDAIPESLSRPHLRYTLQPTALSTKSIHTLLSLRGPHRTNAAPGGWCIYTDSDAQINDTSMNLGCSSLNSRKHVLAQELDVEKEKVLEPLLKRGRPSLDSQVDLNSTGPAKADERTKRPDSPATERRKSIAASRFGFPACPTNELGLETFGVKVADGFPALPDHLAGSDAEDLEADWRPDVKFSFQGNHVFAGMRRLVESGVVDGKDMPGWMTGEAGVSWGILKEGRVKGKEL